MQPGFFRKSYSPYLDLIGIKSYPFTMRGRKPKPTALKLLHGNPGKRPLPPNELKPGGKAVCPGFLDDLAKDEWNRLAPELELLGLLTAVDSSALAAYCQNYSRWVQAESIIQEQGLMIPAAMGGMKTNPAVTVANEALRLIKAFLVEFGLTPSARSRLTVSKGQGEIDAFEEFLSA